MPTPPSRCWPWRFYLYSAMAFSLGVEALNIRARGKRQAKAAEENAAG